MPPADVTYLRAKAHQFRSLAETYDADISPRLLELAKELEARARTLEREAATGEAKQLRRQVADALRQAVARAGAGDGLIAAKLVEFAAELQIRAEKLTEQRQLWINQDARRIGQLWLQADETRAIADATENMAARDTLLVAAQSCERMAISLAGLAKAKGQC